MQDVRSIAWCNDNACSASHSLLSFCEHPISLPSLDKTSKLKLKVFRSIVIRS
eukprot:COSAG06_NODE_581_length_14007_cov_3.569056_18_plen_53_part_00